MHCVWICRYNNLAHCVNRFASFKEVLLHITALWEHASWRVVTLSLTMRAEAMRDAEGWSGAYGVDGGDDIYIMMQCLSVTKNEHFLKRSVCLFVMFYPHFFKSRK